MSLVHAHVTQTVDDDARANDTDDERHDDREVVDVELVGNGDVMRYREVEIGRQTKLDNGEHDGKRLLVVDALDEDVEAQDDLDCERNVIDDHRGGIADGKHVSFR